MHLVAKKVKGHEYYYLVEKARRGSRVVTTKTVYIGDRKNLASLLTQQASAALPDSFASQQVGASLALAAIAEDLGIEKLIDNICPVRKGAAPVGRRLLVAAIHRVLAARGENSKRELRPFYEASSLIDLLPISAAALDDRRIGEMLAGLGRDQIERIEGAVVQRVVEQEKVGLSMLAFDCTNFDSYAAASTKSQLLQRGHSKSGRPLRILGLGLLVTEDDGIPLLSFAYPGNENDVTAFARFLRALDRRHSTLPLPIDATVAADGGNISKKILQRLEGAGRHYVMRLPPKHLAGLAPCKSSKLPEMSGRLRKAVRARKVRCNVYGVDRDVVDVYSRRMHRRQLPGLRRDRDRARRLLEELQAQLERQRKGLRRAKPLTLAVVRRRIDDALGREHMEALFTAEAEKAEKAPVVRVREHKCAWRHLEQYVLGRTLLVTNRKDWSAERAILASRVQSHNERDNRDIKDPEGMSMLPLRHRRDGMLRANALVVVLGLMLVKVLLRRVRRAGLKATSVSSVLRPLKRVCRARMHFGDEAPPALRALAKSTWVPSLRSARQTEILEALGLATRNELGTTMLGARRSGSERTKGASPR